MQLGMIGLGLMGTNITRRVMQAGHECVVYDQDPGAVTALAGHGATGVASVAELAGNPALVLVEAARGADLLVVGGRGHGELTSAMLGSVSHHCAQHAAGCPVVIVRHDAPSPPEEKTP